MEPDDSVVAGAPILIAEDSPTQSARLRYLLEERGHEVVVAANGRLALAAAREHPPSLVITDVVMPEMDGYTLCREIKGDDRLKDIPVVLLTSLSSALDVIKGLECGADNFIRKPYDDDYLLSHVRHVLDNRKLRKSTRMQMGVEIFLNGQRHFISSDRQQILDLLISTYEQAVQITEVLLERESDLARSHETINGLYRMAGGLNEASTEQEVAEIALDRALELPGIQAGWVFLRHGQSGFRVAATRGLEGAVGVSGTLESDCLCRRRLLSGELDAVVNILECERLRPAAGGAGGLRYHASVPLWIGDRTLGIINLVGPGEGLFGEADLKILYGVGNQIGLALERARLHEYLEREVEKRTEALRESEQRYRLLFDTNPLPMWVYDAETRRFLAVNDAATRHYGYSRDEFLAMTIHDIRLPEEGETLGKEEVARAHGPFESLRVSKHRKKDGTLIDVEIAGSPIEFQGRRAWLALSSDVTEKKLLESQFLQSQKMESVGRLAGGVAHDFNNLLGVITGYGELLGKQLPDDERVKKYLSQILKAAGQASGLTRQLLAFSRKQVLQPHNLNLNIVVGELEKMLQRLIGENIQLVTRLGEDLGQVKADRGQIEQVVMNLAVNARDAMPKGGNLTIETANVDLDVAYARSRPGVEPGPHVMLAVSDSGHGMSKEVQEHLFEPFFTTKEVGKGTGLGLATVHGIVRQSGGHIFVYSEPEHGTTFKIYLPRLPELRETVEPASEAAPQPRGSETVLLVEDEESLRSMIRECLEESGYTVLEAHNAAHALELVRAHPAPVQLLMTDVVMPGMSGRELAARLAASQEGLRVLYMSGYTDDAVVLHGVLAEDVAFLQKPFTMEGLTQKVREVIDRPPRG